jgi:hypothetical protein
MQQKGTANKPDLSIVKALPFKQSLIFFVSATYYNISSAVNSLLALEVPKIIDILQEHAPFVVLVYFFPHLNTQKPC